MWPSSRFAHHLAGRRSTWATCCSCSHCVPARSASTARRWPTSPRLSSSATSPGSATPDAASHAPAAHVPRPNRPGLHRHVHPPSTLPALATDQPRPTAPPASGSQPASGLRHQRPADHTLSRHRPAPTPADPRGKGRQPTMHFIAVTATRRPSLRNHADLRQARRSDGQPRPPRTRKSASGHPESRPSGGLNRFGREDFLPER